MFDLVCQICTEPFEHYYVVHEMGALEREAFVAVDGGFAGFGMYLRKVSANKLKL